MVEKGGETSVKGEGEGVTWESIGREGAKKGRRGKVRRVRERDGGGGGEGAGVRASRRALQTYEDNPSYPRPCFLIYSITISCALREIEKEGKYL